MTEESFLKQNFLHHADYWNKVVNTIYPYVKLWNQYSNIDYFTYRHQIQNIAVQNLNNLLAQKVQSLDDFDLTRENIFLAVDDDDFFHPEIYSYLNQKITEDVDVVIWNHLIIGSQMINGSNQVMNTNNYAFTTNGLIKLIRKPVYSDLVQISGVKYTDSPFAPHYDLNFRVFKKTIQNQIPKFNDFDQLDDFKILRLNDHLSATNKSLASASVLMRISNGFDFLNELKKVPYTKMDISWLKNECLMLNEIHYSMKIELPKIF